MHEEEGVVWERRANSVGAGVKWVEGGIEARGKEKLDYTLWIR